LFFVSVAEPKKQSETIGSGSASPNRASTPTQLKKDDKKEEKVETAAAAEEVKANEEEEVDAEILEELFGKEHLNIVFIGHVGSYVETGSVIEKTFEFLLLT